MSTMLVYMCFLSEIYKLQKVIFMKLVTASSNLKFKSNGYEPSGLEAVINIQLLNGHISFCFSQQH